MKEIIPVILYFRVLYHKYLNFSWLFFIISSMKSRYERQIACSFIGDERQDIIQKSTVAIIGCGALGSIISDNLARAGVGELHIFDHDVVDISNLQRQVLFTEEDIGKKKVAAATKRLSSINSQTRINTGEVIITRGNCGELLKGMDLLIDATDDIQTSLVLNEYAVRNKLPMVFGGIAGEEGNIMVYQPGGPCLACVVPLDLSAVPTAQTHGIIPSLPVVAGGIMVTEALKCLVKSPDILRKWWKFHLWKISSDLYELTKNPHCTNCRDY